MALFKDWQDFADKKSAEPGAEQYWTQYFLRERDFYEKLLKGEYQKEMPRVADKCFEEQAK